MYYNQDSIEGFCSAVGSIIGITFKYSVGGASTDGKTITLPPIKGVFNEPAFKSHCGTAIHEAAHVLFNSVPLHQAFIGSVYDPYVGASASNGILDVADETRILSYLPNAEEFLRMSNENSRSRIIKNDEFASNASDTCWACVAAAILNVRIKPTPQWRKYLKGLSLTRRMCIKELTRIFSKARNRKMTKDQITKRKSNARMREEERRLIELMNEAYTCLVRNGCAAPSNYDPNNKSNDKNQPFVVGDYHKPGTICTYGDSMPDDNIDAGDIVTRYVAGEIITDGTQPSTPNSDPNRYHGQWAIKGKRHDDIVKETTPAVEIVEVDGSKSPTGGYCKKDDRYYINMVMYEEIVSAIRGPVQRMAASDDCGGCVGSYYSGHDLTPNLENVFTGDGCFGRRDDEGEDLHIMLMLDVSWSMRKNSAPEAMAIAEAFANSIRPFAKTFAQGTFQTHHEWVDSYRRCNVNGNTNTPLAIDTAVDRLSGCVGKRIIVVITDGMPGDKEETIRACDAANSIGIKMIGISWKFDPDKIVDSMPYAKIVSANTPAELSMQLSIIASQLV